MPIRGEDLLAGSGFLAKSTTTAACHYGTLLLINRDSCFYLFLSIHCYENLTDELPDAAWSCNNTIAGVAKRYRGQPPWKRSATCAVPTENSIDQLPAPSGRKGRMRVGERAGAWGRHVNVVRPIPTSCGLRRCTRGPRASPRSIGSI